MEKAKKAISNLKIGFDAETYDRLLVKLKDTIQIPRIHAKREQIWRGFIAFTILLYFFGISFSVIGTYSNNYTIEEVEFSTEVSYQRAVENADLLFDNVSILPEKLEIFTVKAYIIKPTNPKTTPMPGIVWQHGMVVNRELNFHNAIEYASAGFCVLVTSLPGHGGSGGLWDLGINGLQVIWSGVEYLANLSYVDSDKIAVSGHSNGGIITTRAGIFDKTPFGTGKIKAVGAIYAISDLNETTEIMVGETVLDDPDWGLILATFAGCTDGIITTEDSNRRSITKFINSTNIPNYYLMTGDNDQLSKPKMQFHVFQEATDSLFTIDELQEAYNADHNLSVDNLESGGDFASGTARKLTILEGQDHIEEVVIGENFIPLIDWMVKSLDLSPENHVSRMERGINVDILYNLRFLGWILTLIATICLMINMAPLAVEKIFPRAEKILPQFYRKIEADQLKEQCSICFDDDGQEYRADYIGNYMKFIKSWKEKIWYILLIAVSLTIGLAVSWLIDQYFLNFWIMNQYIMQFFVAGIVLLFATLMMYIAYKIGDRRTKLVNLERVGLSFKGFRQGLMFAGLVTGIPIILYNIISKFTIQPLWFPRPISGRLYAEVGLVFIMVFVFYFSLETVSKTQLFELPYQYPNWRGYVQEITINGTIMWTIWIFAYLVGGLTINANLKTLFFTNLTGGSMLIVVNGIMIFTQGLFAYISAFFYQKTKNIFAVSLTESILTTMIITGQLVFIYAVV